MIEIHKLNSTFTCTSLALTGIMNYFVIFRTFYFIIYETRWNRVENKNGNKSIYVDVLESNVSARMIYMMWELFAE